MKNIEDEPKEYIERNIAIVVIVLSLGLLLDWACIHLLTETNPWGTLVGIPGLVLTLQGLWLLVNPYAVIYDNRFEIKQSLIYNREFFYLDAKAIELKHNKNLVLTYNDGDLQNLPLFGIRGSHKPLFLEKLSHKISESVKGRDF